MSDDFSLADDFRGYVIANGESLFPNTFTADDSTVRMNTQNKGTIIAPGLIVDFDRSNGSVKYLNGNKSHLKKLLEEKKAALKAQELDL